MQCPVFCTLRHYARFGHYDLLNSTDKSRMNIKCLSACNDQRDDLLITNSRHPHLHLRAPAFCTIVSKIKSSCRLPFKANLLKKSYGQEICDLVSDPSSYDAACTVASSNYFMEHTAINATLKRHVLQYAEDNVLAVYIYFVNTAVTRVVKDEKLSIIWYIAAIGGILGLCMGASVITIFEVLWYGMKLCGICSKNTSFKIRRSAAPHYVTVS